MVRFCGLELIVGKVKEVVKVFFWRINVNIWGVKNNGGEVIEIVNKFYGIFGWSFLGFFL